MKQTILLLAGIFMTTVVFSGEGLTGYPSNPSLNSNLNKNFQLHKQQQRIATLSLPFFDDFYQESAYPDASKWEDNFVYINQSFPVDPVSIGVATFDGLNAVGNAYSLIPTASGYADKLTSLPIDLSGLSIDSSVFLSFYYQAGGMGEMPEFGSDKLTVEFMKPDSTWEMVWQITMDSMRPFRQAFIEVDTPYFYGNFQFRFNAIGNLAGMNDIWNVDYVKLDKNRNRIIEQAIKEMAFQYPAPTLLTQYYSIPYNQYDTTDLKDTVRLYVKNNFINPTTDIVDDYEATLLNDGSTIATFSGPSRDFGPDTKNEISYSKFTIPTTYTGDTITVQVKYNYSVSAEAGLDPIVQANNTIYRNQVFNNFMAYDDGTPERGYWVTGVDGYKLAVGYKLRTPDTLQALKMQFSPVQSDIDLALFSVMVWKNITVGTSTDQVIYEDDFMTISKLVQEYGYDTLNGYLYYNMRSDKVKNGADFPLFMSDSFYVGLWVTNKNSLTVGYDRNNDGSSHNYYYDGLKWYQAGFAGSMIINPILGKPLPGNLTPVTYNRNDYTVKLYPNPASSHIYLSGVKENSYVEIIDLYGQVKKSFDINNDRLIGLEELPPAMYVLRITDKRSNAVGTAKFIKIE